MFDEFLNRSLTCSSILRVLLWTLTLHFFSGLTARQPV